MLSYSASRANLVRVLIALSRANEVVWLSASFGPANRRGEIGDIDDEVLS